ncbi:MAG TPA: hypothetical protein VEL74_24470, partial [Thermoanaerobaculia bacterium]|nr:hypothetical protein [Thermoanaerobaculia bacterium]
MSRKFVWLLMLAFAGAAHAGPEALIPTPTASSYDVLDVNQVGLALPAQLDLAKIGEEDMARDRKGLPPRFAVPERVSLTPAEHGTWEELPDGKVLWRLRVVGGAGTTSLNLGFTRYNMPKGGRLLLYATDGTQ